MHLSNCFDQVSSAFSIDRNVRSCVYDWSFKTTTEFHGWDDRLHLDALFGLLCWSYSLAGMMMFAIKPSWTKRSCFPHIFFACILTFVQGPLSFSADYMNMTNDSIIHVVDRVMAVFNLVTQSCKVFLFFCYGRPSTFCFHLAAISFAVFSFLNSQDAQEAKDIEGFMFWHNCWHIYPILGIIIESFDFYYLGDYDYLSERKTQGDSKFNAQTVWKYLKSSLSYLDSKYVSYLFYMDSKYVVPLGEEDLLEKKKSN